MASKKTLLRIATVLSPFTVLGVTVLVRWLAARKPQPVQPLLGVVAPVEEESEW